MERGADRSMTRVTIVAAVGVFVASLASISLSSLTDPSEAVSRSASCGRADSKTLASTAAVRVYRRKGLTYACAYRRGRHFHLGDDPPEGIGAVRIGIIRIAGRYVAFDTTAFNKNEPDYGLRVVDARTGRTKRDGAALYSGDEPHDPAVDGGVTDIELKPNGSVAWIVENPFAEPARRWEVNTSDRSKDRDRILDTGADIAPVSLASSGSTLYWTNASQAWSATFK